MKIYASRDKDIFNRLIGKELWIYGSVLTNMFRANGAWIRIVDRDEYGTRIDCLTSPNSKIERCYCKGMNFKIPYEIITTEELYELIRK